MSEAPLEVVPLGGVGEFGRNVLWLRCGASSILIDVGVSFPDESFPGIDRIAPDLSVLRGERIDGVFLTHGHEDHVGALSFLREWCPAPVYGFPFTLALARRRLEEARTPLDRMIEARGREPIVAGAFTVTFFRVSPSVPGSAAVLVEAGGRRLIHSGDFKLDDDPPDGETTDREGIAAVGEGVDSPSWTDQRRAAGPVPVERVAGEGLRAAFQGAGPDHSHDLPDHVSRIAGRRSRARRGRRVALLGRSMRAVAEIAERFGACACRPARARRRTTCGASAGPPPLHGFRKPGRAVLGAPPRARRACGLELEGDVVLSRAPSWTRTADNRISGPTSRGARRPQTQPPIHARPRAATRPWNGSDVRLARCRQCTRPPLLAAAAEIAAEDVAPGAHRWTTHWLTPARRRARAEPWRLRGSISTGAQTAV